MRASVTSAWIPAVQGLFIRGYIEADHRPTLLRVVGPEGNTLVSHDMIELRTDLGPASDGAAFYNTAMAAFQAGPPDGELTFEALNNNAPIVSCKVAPLRTVTGFSDLAQSGPDVGAEERLNAILQRIYEFFGKNAEWCRKATETRLVQTEVARSPTALRNVILSASGDDAARLQIAKALLQDRALNLREPAGRYLAYVTGEALGLQASATNEAVPASAQSDQQSTYALREALDKAEIQEAIAKDFRLVSELTDKLTGPLTGTPRGRELGARLLASKLLSSAAEHASKNATDFDTALIAIALQSDVGKAYIEQPEVFNDVLSRSGKLQKRVAARPEIAGLVLKAFSAPYHCPEAKVPRGPLSEKPAFSVIMAVYNGAEFLPDAIDSVLAQTFTDFEMIIVDDCSSDRSGEIAAGYAAADRRIRVLRNEINRGQSYSFNRAFSKTHASHIAYIDADDLWFPEKLARVKAFIDTGEQFCFLQHNLLLMFHAVPSQRNFRPTLQSGDYIAAMIESGAPLPGPFTPTTGIVFPRTILEKIGPIPNALRVCSDGFLTRAAVTLGPVASLASPLGYYRLHGDNATVGNDDYDGNSYTSRVLMPILMDYYARSGYDIVLPTYKELRRFYTNLVVPAAHLRAPSEVDVEFSRVWTYVSTGHGSVDDFSPAFRRMLAGIQNAIFDGDYGRLNKDVLGQKFFNAREQALFLLLDCLIRLLASDNNAVAARLERMPQALQRTVVAHTLRMRLYQRTGRKQEIRSLLTDSLQDGGLVDTDVDTIAEIFAERDAGFGATAYLQVQRAVIAFDNYDLSYFDNTEWIQERTDVVIGYEAQNCKTGATYRGFAMRCSPASSSKTLQALPASPDWSAAKLLDLAGPIVLAGEWLIRTLDGVCLSDLYVGTPHHRGSSYGSVTQARTEFDLLYPREPTLSLEAVFLAGGDRNYYHWVLDVLPRLFCFRHSPDVRNLQLVTGTIDRPFQTAILAAAGLQGQDLVQVPYPSTFRADRLVVPLMGPPNRKDLPLYSPIVRFIHDFVASAVVPDYTKEPWSGTGTRLFVLRGAAKHRCVINESEIAQALEAEGWRIIDPATLSFEQQIAAFNTASHVAASHGAGLANLAFCRPGTEVIELAFPRWSPTYFEAVSLGRDLRHHTLQMQEIQSLQRLAKLNDGFISPALSRRIIQFGAE